MAPTSAGPKHSAARNATPEVEGMESGEREGWCGGRPRWQLADPVKQGVTLLTPPRPRRTEIGGGAALFLITQLTHSPLFISSSRQQAARHSLALAGCEEYKDVDLFYWLCTFLSRPQPTEGS